MNCGLVSATSANFFIKLSMSAGTVAKLFFNMLTLLFQLPACVIPKALDITASPSLSVCGIALISSLTTLGIPSLVLNSKAGVIPKLSLPCSVFSSLASGSCSLTLSLLSSIASYFNLILKDANLFKCSTFKVLITSASLESNSCASSFALSLSDANSSSCNLFKTTLYNLLTSSLE